MNKMKTKLIASMLVFLMMFTYISILGEAIAASLDTQDNQTNHPNVEFDAYFMQDNKKAHTSLQTIGEENYLYATVAVKEAGYLKNATISFHEANFQVIEAMQSDTVNKVESNQITLNQINSGNTVELAIPIQMVEKANIKVEEFDKENAISFTATYVDGNGKEKKIAKDVIVQLAWTAETQVELTMQVAKFIPYNLNGQKGLMLQTILQSQLKDNTLPVKENKIEISTPMINNEKPQSVKVVANTTKATNGDETGIGFNQENYSYDSNSGLLTIQTNNMISEEGTVAWNKQAQDEFVITYLYPETTIPEEGIDLSMVANATLIIWDREETKIGQSFEGSINVKEPISSLVDFTVETISELSKGQMYANELVENKIETEYETILTANIGLAEVTDKVIIQAQADNFVAGENEELAAETYYKTISLSKETFDKLLGEEGSISLYVEETKIAEINSTTEVNEQGMLQIDLAEFNVNTISIEISKPVTEGKMILNIKKAIKGEIGYSAKQMQSVTNLEQKVSIKAISGTETFAQQTITKEIVLKEPTMQAEIALSNANLSTVITNQNVKLTAILKTDTLDCSLYHNPTLQIVLPKYIETINIKNIEVLFETEGTKLVLKDSQLIQNQDGTKTIFIQLEGTQTEYTLGAISKGVNVVITADITANKLTPNKEEQIIMTYTNNTITTKSNKPIESQVSTKVNFIAPIGVVTTASISNYAENAESITSISGEEKTATIETMAEARNATFEMNVINNYPNSIDHISILGRIPSKGNLNSTMDMPLPQEIQVSGVDENKVEVYYSENANATKDLKAEVNNWTLTPESFENVKSYLIELNDYTMNTADMMNFSYTAQIPENLQHNESAYENYEVYFNNNLETGILQDKQVATKIGVTTGKGPELETSLSSNTPETEEKLMGSIIQYTLTVTNTGTESAQNVMATIMLPEGLNYVEKDENISSGYKIVTTSGNEVAISLGNVGPNQTIKKEIDMQVGIISSMADSETNTKQDTILAEVKANITADNLPNAIETQIVKNTLAKAHFMIASTVMQDNEVLKEGEEYTYYLEMLSSDLFEVKQETVLEITFPEEIIYQNVEVHWNNINEDKSEINYNKKEKILTINLGDVDGINSVAITLHVKAGTLPEGVYDKQANITAKVSAKEAREQYVNIEPVQIAKLGFTITQSSNIPEKTHIAVGENFSYIFTIQNLSSISLYDVKFTDILPEELTLNSMIVKDESDNIQTTYQKDINFTIGPKEIITVQVNVTANILEETKTISNKAKIESEEIGIIETSSYQHIIDKFEESDYPTDPSTSDTQTKRIMGTVWLDENTNGAREEQETKMSNVEVLLFNNETGMLATDAQGNVVRTMTDENGTYTFSAVKQGKYTVIFLYDTVNYSATSYHMENVDASMNSDAVDSQITLDGQTKLAAITEEIAVMNSNIYSIDLGLVSNPKFDLKLDKTVASITVQDSSGTNQYDCKDTKLAKRDLVGKKINDTTIIVEYKIKVTNEGAISGFVKKIADYMPSEMKFNSELNKDWYTSENGVLFNASLANTILNPGESKEVTLLLTKKMTDENVGLYNNTAEIYEAYNDLGVADMDSTVANKQSNEDDLSSADVLITVKTGETILFIGLSFTIILTIGIGAYFIKKKVLR